MLEQSSTRHSPSWNIGLIHLLGFRTQIYASSPYNTCCKCQYENNCLLFNNSLSVKEIEKYFKLHFWIFQKSLQNCISIYYIYTEVTKLKRNNLRLRSFFEIEMPLWKGRQSFRFIRTGYHRTIYIYCYSPALKIFLS